MERIWAPWRHAYVAANPAPAAAADPCFLCAGVQDSDDRKNLIPLRGHLGVVMLNRFPYNAGHLLVAPRAHKGRPAELDAAELLELQQLIVRMIAVLDAVLRPDGYNIGLNLGKAAGAGLPGHLHWHIVPRWNGDTNFMPVLGETRVLNQSLESLYDVLVAQLKP